MPAQRCAGRAPLLSTHPHLQRPGYPRVGACSRCTTALKPRRQAVDRALATAPLSHIRRLSTVSCSLPFPPPPIRRLSTFCCNSPFTPTLARCRRSPAARPCPHTRRLPTFCSSFPAFPPHPQAVDSLLQLAPRAVRACQLLAHLGALRLELLSPPV
eukprot:365084-Chlamydomonas_euryale.AAC.28